MTIPDCYEEWEDALWDLMSVSKADPEDLCQEVASHFDVPVEKVEAEYVLIQQAWSACDAERDHERKQLYGGRY